MSDFGLPVPAGAIVVVGAALGGGGEDGVGLDDEAIAGEFGGWGKDGVGVRRRRGGVVVVWMVDFYELVEAAFGVGMALFLGQDLIGGWDGGC